MAKSLDDAADEVYTGLTPAKQEESGAQSVLTPTASPWDAAADEAFTVSSKPTPVPQRSLPPEPPDASDKSFEGSTIQLAVPIPGLTDKRWDTGIPMPGGAKTTKALAQFGSGLTDVGLGLDQVLGRAGTAEADEKHRMDDPLNKGFMGTTLNMAGKAAPFVAGAAGGMFAAPVLGGASSLAPWMAAAPVIYGGAQGAMEPVQSHGPGRGVNTFIGGLSAGMGPLTSKVFGLGPDKVAGPLAREAAADGYKVTPADANTQGIVGYMRNKLGQLPVIGQRPDVIAHNEAKFTEKVASTWGGTAESLANEGRFLQDGKDIGTKITGVYKNNPLTITNQFEKKLQSVHDGLAASDAGRNEVKKVMDEIAGARVFDKKSGQYIADGEKIQTVLENLQARSRGDPKAEMNKVRTKLYDTIKAEYTGKLKPEDAERLEKALSQRKAWESMQDYVAKTSKGVAGREKGKLTPDDVALATKAMYGNEKAPVDRILEVGQHMLRPAKTPPNFGNVLNLPGAIASTGVAAAPSRFINSPMAYKALNNPIVAGALNRAGSPVVRPLVTQGALSATEGVSDTMHKGAEDMKRYLGR
jgi:hypothetical protein